jgi:hypothetical protein
MCFFIVCSVYVWFLIVCVIVLCVWCVYVGFYFWDALTKSFFLFFFFGGGVKKQKGPWVVYLSKGVGLM